MVQRKQKMSKNKKHSIPSSSKMLFYESIADSFDSVVNMYDTTKRLEVIFNELLPKKIKGKKLLDAGCGTGWASAWAAERGAKVTSMDVGDKLLKEVAKKCKSKRVKGSILEMPFRTNSFDIVVSTEVIEHVEDPQKAIKEMFRVLKPGGVLALTTPNKFWHWSVTAANSLGIRPYQGLENWFSWHELQDACKKAGFSVKKTRGIHAFPFVIKQTHSLLNYLDRHQDFLGPIMVNQAIKARKPK